MKHSKWIALLLTGVCAVSLLAGCGSKEKDTSPQTSSQQQGSAKLNEEVYEGSVLSGTVMNYGDEMCIRDRYYSIYCFAGIYDDPKCSQCPSREPLG